MNVFIKNLSWMDGYNCQAGTHSFGHCWSLSERNFSWGELSIINPAASVLTSINNNSQVVFPSSNFDKHSEWTLRMESGMHIYLFEPAIFAFLVHLKIDLDCRTVECVFFALQFLIRASNSLECESMWYSSTR